MRGDDDKLASSMSRRETLQLAPGMIMLGAGLGAFGWSAAAEAAGRRLVLRFYERPKRKGQPKKLVHEITVPASMVKHIRRHGASKIKMRWTQGEGKRKKVLAEHPLPAHEGLQMWLSSHPDTLK